MHRNTHLALSLALVLGGFSQFAAGATLCVGKGSGCLATIGAAVSAASPGDVIQVSHGTYHEDVVIGKSLSLIGENPKNTIIDATGLLNGIYVDGMDNPGLAGVVVSGFGVQNANIEGILVTNATDVTIVNNEVSGNNTHLDADAGTCAGIPAFETAEGFDCGEGIHFSGVDHSIIANNTSEKNAGGILLSDDTGPTHDNLVIGNTVQYNPFDCGITMASHPLYVPGTPTGPPTVAGVYHNTVTGNNSNHNGLQLPGAGAGIGMFAPAPFTKTYGNVVVNNDVTDNGLPGISMHAHAPGASLADNMIAGNRISRNAADTDDTFTSGPTGVNVSGGDNGSGSPLAAITGVIVAGNVIDQESIAVATKSLAPVMVHLNDFTNDTTGIDNISGAGVDGSMNWWGCGKGPGAPGCAATVGSGIFDLPFLTSPF